MTPHLAEAEPRRRSGAVPVPLRLLIVVVAGYLYGFVTEHLPAPRTDATIFWIGNLAAPYLLIPLLAGAWNVRRSWALAAGALGSASAVAGFYGFLSVWQTNALEQGLPPGTGRAQAVGHAYAFWFRNLVLGYPSGTPWLSIAIVVGLAFGYLGYRWHASGSRLGPALVAAAFVVEPLVHLSGLNTRLTGGGYALHASNAAIWGAEALLGLIGLAWAAWWPRGDVRDRPATTEAVGHPS